MTSATGSNDDYPPTPVTVSPVAGVDDFKPPFSARTLRWIELALVLSVAVGQPLAAAVFVTFTGAEIRYQDNISLLSFSAILRYLPAIALLAYVLFRQGRQIADIGFGWRWQDLPAAMSLTALAYLAALLAQYGLFSAYFSITGDTLDLTPRNIPAFAVVPAAVLMMIVNPFYEELILRAYAITEIEHLTGRASVAVLCSVGLQTVLHFYQGIPVALVYAPIFLIYAVYYVRRRRILPIILSHMLFDLTALIFSTMQGRS